MSDNTMRLYKIQTKHKAGFTLVEMLIVIVIIGILASALIPRLSQARERANDTARRAHLQNVATVLIAYQIDKGKYPATGGALSDKEGELTSAGLSSVPTDPVASRVFDGVGPDSSCSSDEGQYMYTPIIKGNIDGGGFLLMAGTQTEGGSNYAYTGSTACIDGSDDYKNIKECGPGQDKLCSAILEAATSIEDGYRYIYKQ